MSTIVLLHWLCRILVFFAPFKAVFPQSVNWIQGARTASLANAHVALSEAWNTAGNPAGIAALTRPTLSFGMERRFFISELDTRAVTAVVPAGSHSFGLNVNFFGSELYNEQQISLAYARALSERFSAGIRINYHGLKIPAGPHQQAWSVGTGIQFAPLPRLKLGAAVYNPNRAVFNGAVYAEIPFIVSMGLACDFSEKVMGTVAADHTFGGETRLRTGVEYRLHPNFGIRGGISTNPFTQYGGLGLLYQGLALDLAASSHLYLGLSPQISLGYEF